MKKNVLWITKTALFIALLVVAQITTAGLGNTLVTGSIVNFILIASTMLSSISSGATVAILSPIFAKLIGIGPFWEIIPFIAIGNLVLVLVWYLIAEKIKINQFVSSSIACVVGAVVKFAVLYFGVVKFAIPVILQLPEKQAGIIGASFSVPQLITALVGGVVAVVLVPVLKKAIKSSER